MGLPFAILLLITNLNYEAERGDLIRIGYISDNFPDYRNQFKADLSKEIKYNRLTDNSEKKEYDILTIGDSFSEQGPAGYQNYLELTHGKSVLHIDYSLHNNPFQMLICLQNSNFFEEFKIKNVVLEVVERDFIGIAANLNRDSSLNYQSLKPILKNHIEPIKTSVISNRIFKFPYYLLYRNLYPEKLVSDVYARKLKNRVFSVESKILYFYYLDVINIMLNNSIDDLKFINNILNTIGKDLKNNGVNLIVLPVPDKYHFYKNDLEYQSEFESLLFFTNYSTLKKEYTVINLLDAKKDNKLNVIDFYYYDDSHWSPNGSMVVAEMIFDILR
ncbi:hypothetical protein U3A58_18665 [Algoriphagus sp. C2-6-M1]|uniref:alginate O-acetyltransferase AlgX-related protein n=1 Tax=Algoriphagus persicinus TaxID=3108754 RepID=UPI002B36DC72|nr:hypothetical protein [Algoriphagus sp. C2-6-M1]MEB2782419.1 hypothetical protein [Algoriphagus sp. C2-6-M1]